MRSWQLIPLIFYREGLLCYRNRSELLLPFLFFILVCSLFPLAMTPNKNLLLSIGPGIIWVTALLSTLLSLPKLYREDYDDGSIEQFIQNSYPLSFVLFLKIMMHWLIYGFPLVLISPFLALMYQLPFHAIIILMYSLLLGTLFLNFIGSIFSALTVGLRNNGILLALLILPVYIPGLIFGASSAILAESNIPVAGMMAILSILLIFAMLFSPLASAFALRIGVCYDR